MSQTLIIGLDSADADLIDGWCRDGYLPTLATLRREGAWGRLETTAEVMHVSAWPTLHTGASPGRHGLYHAYQVRAGQEGFHRTRPEEGVLPPFWRFLDDAGLRCIVFDAFLQSPLESFQGIQIFEYGSWTWFTDPGATPRSIWKEIIRRFGRYPAPEHTQVLTVPEPSQFRDQLVAGAECKGQVVRWLLGNEDWDFAFITFAEPHGAGHYLWHLGDPEYPAHPGETVSGSNQPLRDVYVAVDRAIDAILTDLDPSTNVMITSGDGMGPNYAGCHLMPEMLHRLGLLTAASVGDGESGDAQEAAVGISLSSVLSGIRGAIPMSFRNRVSRCLPREIHYRMSMKWLNADVDWNRSRAVCFPNANEGYFRVNLQGREPRGTVPQGTPFVDLLDLLSDHLQEIVNPDNGIAAVEQIFRADDVLPGPQRPHLPDLIATWNPRARVLSEVQSERLGSIKRKAAFEMAPFYTGNHRPQAFLLARGDSIPENHALEGGHILDIAPTVLTSFGVDLPAQFEGRPLTALTAG